MRRQKANPSSCSVEDIVARILIDLAEGFEHEETDWTIKIARVDRGDQSMRSDGFDVTIKSGTTDRFFVRTTARLSTPGEPLLLAARIFERVARNPIENILWLRGILARSDEGPE